MTSLKVEAETSNSLRILNKSLASGFQKPQAKKESPGVICK
jgi:hypothetical protein